MTDVPLSNADPIPSEWVAGMADAVRQAAFEIPDDVDPAVVLRLMATADELRSIAFPDREFEVPGPRLQGTPDVLAEDATLSSEPHIVTYQTRTNTTKQVCHCSATAGVNHSVRESPWRSARQDARYTPEVRVAMRRAYLAFVGTSGEQP